MTDEFSTTQQKVMRYVFRREPRGGMHQIAGNGRGPWLSACRALVRKGYMKGGTAGYRCGHYGLTDSGIALAATLVAEYDAAAKIAKELSP